MLLYISRRNETQSCLLHDDLCSPRLLSFKIAVTAWKEGRLSDFERQEGGIALDEGILSVEYNIKIAERQTRSSSLHS